MKISINGENVGFLAMMIALGVYFGVMLGIGYGLVAVFCLVVGFVVPPVGNTLLIIFAAYLFITGYNNIIKAAADNVK